MLDAETGARLEVLLQAGGTGLVPLAEHSPQLGGEGRERSAGVGHGGEDGREDDTRPTPCEQGERPARREDRIVQVRGNGDHGSPRDSRQGPGSMRQVFISDYREQVLAAQAYNQTEPTEGAEPEAAEPPKPDVADSLAEITARTGRAVPDVIT